MSRLFTFSCSVLLAALMFSGSAFAASNTSGGIKFLFRTGFDLGGDTLVNVLYTDGTSASIRAGNGFYFAGGASIPLSDKLELDATVGYEFSSISGSNGDITWSYIPVDAVALYKVGRVALGGGLTDHINPSLSGSGVAASVNTSYNDAIGTILEADYVLSKSMLAGLRVTNIKYKNSGSSTNGNSVGLTLMLKY